VTIEEVVEHFHVLERDPDCPDRLDVLLDLSEQTSIPTMVNVKEVSREISRIQGTVQFGACAIIACTDALYGMIRMLQVFTEQLFRESHVCRSISEAEAWLISQRPTSAAAG
jgi:hypothetical protein